MLVGRLRCFAFAVPVVALAAPLVPLAVCYNNRLLISYNDNNERCELKQKFDKLKEYF